MVHIADEGGTEIERETERGKERERERRDKSSEPARAI